MTKLSHGRARPPVYSPAGSLYDTVRCCLKKNGGTCTRDQLEQQLGSRPEVHAKIASAGGLGPLLTNMRHSGEITLEANLVRLTVRALRRMQLFRKDHHEA